MKMNAFFAGHRRKEEIVSYLGLINVKNNKKETKVSKEDHI